mgnify:CR=1 FL=1
MEQFTCYGCKKSMPGQVLRPMAHISGHHALVILMCPLCQQKYGDNNPNYHYATLSPAVIAAESQKYSQRRSSV